MFKFVNEYNKKYYNEINRNVLSKMHEDECIKNCVDIIEKLAKIIWDDSGVILYATKNDKTYRELNPTFGQLFNDENFKDFLFLNEIVSIDDMPTLWKLDEARNYLTHGAKRKFIKGEIIELEVEITDELKIEAVKWLYNFCYNIYHFKFQEKPNSKWDNDYIKSLLTGPKTEPAEKNIKDTKKVDALKEKNAKQKDKIKSQKNTIDAQKIALQEKDKTIEEQLKENETLKKIIEESKTIERKALPRYTGQEVDLSKFKPAEKPALKKVATSKSKQEIELKLNNTIVLTKIENVSINYSMGMIFDMIDKGMFEAAKSYLVSESNVSAESRYANLLCNLSKKSINEFSISEVLSNLNDIKYFLNQKKSRLSSETVETLSSFFFDSKNAFNQLAIIFKVLAPFDFKERDKVINTFGSLLKNQISNQKSFNNVEYVFLYLDSLDKNYSEEYKNLIELSISNKQFTIANALNSKILTDDPENVFGLTKQLLIECRVTNEDEIISSINRLKDFSLFEKLLDIFSICDPALFRKYYNLLDALISDSSDTNLIFEAYKIIGQYKIDENLSDKVYEILSLHLQTSNNPEIYKQLEYLLQFSKSETIFYERCKDLASKSLDAKIKNNLFILYLKERSPQEYFTNKLAFYHKYDLSLAVVKPIHYTIKEEDIEAVLQVSTAKQRKEFLTELVDSLKASLKINLNEEKVNSVFDNIYKRFLKTEKKETYQVMKDYVECLINRGYFECAEDYLKLMLDLNYRTFEVAMLLTLCDYKVASLEDLFKSKTKLMSNTHFKQALSEAYNNDKVVYNQYLSFTEKQKRQNEIDKTRAEFDERVRLGKEARRLSTIATKSLAFLFIPFIVFLIFIPFIDVALTGLLVVFGSCSLILFTVLLTFKDEQIKPTDISKEQSLSIIKKKMTTTVISWILFAVMMFFAIWGGSSIYNNTKKIKYETFGTTYSITVGRNVNDNTFILSEHGWTSEYTSVKLDFSGNNKISYLVIPSGVKEILDCDFENSGIDRIYIPKTVTEIDYYAFEDFNGKFYYEGSQQEWKNISYFYDKPTSFGIEFNQKYK